MNAVSQGYVNVASDSGHTGSPIDASFAFNASPTTWALFTHLSVPTVTAAAKQIVQQMYGKAPTRSYFEGCSTGGREALMNAVRFPTLFDGVIAQAPAIQLPPTFAHAQRTLRLLAQPGAAVNTNKQLLVQNAVLAQCDGADGLTDGIVANVSACHFDPASLRCPGGADTGDSCLSDAQIAVYTAHTSPSTTAAGALHFEGYSFSGTEALPGQWGAWIFAPNPTSALYAFLDTSVKNVLAKDRTADALAYDFDANALIVRAASADIDLTDANLTSFNSAGGKLMIWQGSGDPAVSPRQTTNYYNAAVAAVGGQANADKFMRYYVAPGVGHCAGGSGADSLSQMLGGLDAWVNSGVAPDSLTSKKTNPADGSTLLSRPMCVYPKFARYKGTGSTTDAANFTCGTS